MSQKTIQKEVDATVCDFCDLEIDLKSEEYCYAHIRTFQGDVREASRTERIKHFIFSWPKPPTKGELYIKPHARQKWIRYDFHASCFEKAMQKFIAEKETK